MPYFFSCRLSFSRLCTNHFCTCRSVSSSRRANWVFSIPEMKLFSRNLLSSSLRMASLNLRTRNFESNIVCEVLLLLLSLSLVCALVIFGIIVPLAISGLGMYGDEVQIWYLSSVASSSLLLCDSWNCSFSFNCSRSPSKNSLSSFSLASRVR